MIINKLGKNPRIQFISIATGTILTVLIAVGHFTINQKISNLQREDNLRWHAIHELKRIDSVNVSNILVNESSWFAPDLWKFKYWGLIHPYPFGKDYWTLYLARQGIRKKVIGQDGDPEVAEVIAKCRQDCEDYSYIRMLSKDENNFALVVGSHAKSKGRELGQVNQLLIMASFVYPEASISYIESCEEGSQAVVNRRSIVGTANRPEAITKVIKSPPDCFISMTSIEVNS
jgi:hypothetical protein